MTETLAEAMARRVRANIPDQAETLEEAMKRRLLQTRGRAPDPGEALEDVPRPHATFVGPPEEPPHLGTPDESASRVIGMKETNRDRVAAAKELYPNARNVYPDPQNDTVTVENPNGEILNFEAPDHTGAVMNALSKLLSRAGGSKPGYQYEPGRGPNDSILERAASLRTGQDVHQEEITPQQARLEEQNAAGALPHIATRGAANLGVAAGTGGAGLAAQAFGYGIANGVVPLANRAINEASPGGDTEHPLSTAWRSTKDTALGVLATLIPGYIAGRVSENAVVNRGVNRLGFQEGVPDEAFAGQLATTDEALPLQSLAKEGPGSDKNLMLLQKMLKNDKVQRTQGLATANVERMSQNAESAVQSATTLSQEADLRARDAADRMRETVRQAKNTARVARQSADEQLAADQLARDTQHTKNMEQYEANVVARNQKYASESKGYSEEVAKIREMDAAKKLDFLKKRAKEATNRAMINNEIDDQIASAKENYGGRYAQNRVAELEQGRPGSVEKFVPPQTTPKPAKPTMDARPLKPTRQPVEKPVADVYQEPPRTELQAANREAEVASQNVDNAKAAQKSVTEMKASLKKSLSRIEKAQGPSILHRLLTGKNVVRAAGAFLTGGKTLLAEEVARAPFQAQRFLDNRAMIKLLADPSRARQMQELAARGERLPVNDVKAVEQFAQDLRAFLAEQPEDSE